MYVFIFGNIMKDIKQVIVIRKDLNMRKGKMIAQGAHASMGAILSVAKKENDKFTIDLLDEKNELSDLGLWLTGKFKKITVYVNSEKELLDLAKKAEDKKLINALILDSGLTEFDGKPTYTALAIGPSESNKVNELTGGLSLL